MLFFAFSARRLPISIGQLSEAIFATRSQMIHIFVKKLSEVKPSVFVNSNAVTSQRLFQFPNRRVEKQGKLLLIISVSDPVTLA